MKHWKFEIAILTSIGIYTFDGDSFAEDEAGPEYLAREALAEIARKRPDLHGGKVIHCRYIQVR